MKYILYSANGTRYILSIDDKLWYLMHYHWLDEQAFVQRLYYAFQGRGTLIEAFDIKSAAGVAQKYLGLEEAPKALEGFVVSGVLGENPAPVYSPPAESPDRAKYVVTFEAAYPGYALKNVFTTEEFIKSGEVHQWSIASKVETGIYDVHGAEIILTDETEDKMLWDTWLDTASLEEMVDNMLQPAFIVLAESHEHAEAAARKALNIRKCESATCGAEVAELDEYGRATGSSDREPLCSVCEVDLVFARRAVVLSRYNKPAS